MNSAKGPINGLIEFTLCFIGLWPGYPYCMLHRIAWTLSMGSILIFQYTYIVTHVALDELPDLMDCLSITLSNSVLFFKLLMLWLNSGTFCKMLSAMKRDWRDSMGNERNFGLMAKKVVLSLRYSKFFFVSYCIGLILFIPPVLLAEKRELILKMELPFDTYASPIYEVLIVAQFLQEFMAVFAAAMMNALVVTLILHVGGQVEIVSHGLLEISSTICKWKIRTANLHRLVERHQRIIDFSHDIEKVFTYIALIQFLSNTLVICSLEFMIVTSLDSDQRVALLVKFVPYYVLANIEAFVLCYMGEYLSSKNKTIGAAAYESVWYRLDRSEKRVILFLIARCQKLSTLTAGKFVDLSMESFSNMVKASASYVSVLYALF